MQDERQRAVREVVLTATRALVGIAARSLAEVGDEVSLAQYRVLVLLDSRGPQTMSELATALDVNPSSVTRVCDALVDKKLIRRSQPQGNRRTVEADLAPAGRRLLDQAMDERRRLIDDALSRMSPQAQRRLARALADFADAAGEVWDHAWTLGWAHAGEDSDGED
jgi:DNA-binding MarR family transcriptional regulator